MLGTVTFRLGDELLGEYNITAPDRIEQLTLKIIFMRIISAFAK